IDETPSREAFRRLASPDRTTPVHWRRFQAQGTVRMHGAIQTVGRRRESESGEVELRLLSGFELRTDGAVVALPMSSQRLLAFLALQHKPLHRIHVAGRLWIDASEDRANANLRTALWRVRQFGGTLIHPTASHLQLVDDV